MLQPKEWNELFASDASAKKLKYTVAMEVRRLLTTVAPGVTLSTNALVEALYPVALAELSLAADNARTTIFKLVGRLAVEGLEDCCMKGEVTGQFMGRPKRPWLWYCPVDTEICSACGQVVVKESEDE